MHASFLNPNTAEFIVIFNNVWLPASWRSCPCSIYFLSDAPSNNPAIPCGPTTQTAAAMRPSSPAPSCPLLQPPCRHSKLILLTCSIQNLRPFLLPMLFSELSSSNLKRRYYFISPSFLSFFFFFFTNKQLPPLSVDSHVWERPAG